MNVWLVNSMQEGVDSLPGDLLSAFRGVLGGSRVFTVRAEEFLESRPDGEPDVLVLVNSIGPYLGWRFHLPGRPWVCAVSFNFADLYSLHTGSVRAGDVGLNCIVTNCEWYVEQSTSSLPCVFSHKPVPEPYRRKPADGSVGIVLPNVADRDFSLASWIYGKLSSRGAGDRFLVFLGNREVMRLPREMEQARRMHVSSDMEAYASLDYYVHTPRITDYRCGLSPEFVKAWALGCKPLAIAHYVLQPLKPKTYSSLTELEADLELIACGSNPKWTERLERPDDRCCPPPDSVVKTILSAYTRWKEEHVG